MANIEDRGQGARLRWRVRWRDPEGQQRGKSFARKADAERYLHELASRLNAGTYLDPNAGKVTVSEIAEPYLRRIDSTRKPSTAYSYREVYTRRVAPRWGRTPVAQIRYSDVSAWVSELSATLSPSRTRHAYRILRVLLDDAVKDRRIPSNPAHGVTLPSLPKRREHPYLTHGQVSALADSALTDRDRALILVLAYCGLRWGEAVALRWEDVDEVRRRLLIRRSLGDVGGRLIETTPKSHAARTIPVPDPAWNALASLSHGDGLIFRTPTDAPLRASSWRRRALDPALAVSGLPRLSPHALRHTAASLAVSSGANVKAVQRMLGHASAAMTLDVYADLFDDDLDALADRISTAAEAAPKWEPPPQISQV